jgi:hypothetical protein
MIGQLRHLPQCCRLRCHPRDQAHPATVCGEVTWVPPPHPRRSRHHPAKCRRCEGDLDLAFDDLTGDPHAQVKNHVVELGAGGALLERYLTD